MGLNGLRGIEAVGGLLDDGRCCGVCPPAALTTPRSETAMEEGVPLRAVLPPFRAVAPLKGDGVLSVLERLKSSRL